MMRGTVCRYPFRLLDVQEEILSVDLQAYCMAGNAHAMDASLKLPKQDLRGTVVDSRETLGRFLLTMPVRNAILLPRMKSYTELVKQ